MPRPQPSRAPQTLRRSGEGGQSLVESTLVIMLVCLIFFGFLQVALLYNHERVLQFASFASTRSATVGFNEDVYTRAYRAAAIPASGSNIVARGLGPRELLALEQIAIPLYLNRDPYSSLNYDYWDRYDMRPYISTLGDSPPMIQEYHQQEHPLVIPMIGAYYDRDTIGIANQSMQAWHYQHYLQ